MRTVTFLLFLAAAADFTHASAQGDPAKGATLAGQHCALCHDISPEGAAKQFPPSFASIAGFRSLEQIYARIVFPTMHSGMPEVAFYLLGKEEIEAIMAYIASLERN